ncbi:MAG: hypothetical protein ACRD3S_20455 [Terracidiphilus sp.]
MATLTGHSLKRGRLWMMAVLALVLIAVHGSILYYASSHLALSAGMVVGIVGLIVVKHLGLFGPAFALLRRRWRKR